MFFRSVKCTCKNTVMKESVRNFYLDNFDLMDPASALMISYKVDLSDNQFLHVGLFASEEVADAFADKLGPIHRQVQEMGAKIEITKGNITHFKVAGGLTLDQLTGNRQVGSQTGTGEGHVHQNLHWMRLGGWTAAAADGPWKPSRGVLFRNLDVDRRHHRPLLAHCQDGP